MHNHSQGTESEEPMKTGSSGSTTEPDPTKQAAVDSSSRYPEPPEADAETETETDVSLRPPPPVPISVRSIVAGCALGALLSAMNVSFGLKTGWIQGGHVLAAIIAIGVFKLFRVHSYSMHETVMTTTAASAAGTMTSAAGLVSSIPALKMLGFTYDIWALFLWALSLAFFGICFAVPLRRQMLDVDKLRFPTGAATGEMIQIMFSKGAETIGKARALAITAVSTAIYALLAFFIPYLEHPPMPAMLRRWGFVLALNPLLFGGGMMAGMRSTGSMMLGTLVGWGLIGSIVYWQDWAPGPVLDYSGVRGWVLWLGVAIMTADSMTQLVISLPMIFKGLYKAAVGIRQRLNSDSQQQPQTPTDSQPENETTNQIQPTTTTQFVDSTDPAAAATTDGGDGATANAQQASDESDDESWEASARRTLLEKDDNASKEHSIEADESNEVAEQIARDSLLNHPQHQIPAYWYLSIIGMASVSTILIGHFMFGIEAWNVIIAIPLSFMLAIIASRCAGETNINPVGGMGKVTQLVFAGVAPGNVRTNLLAAGVVGAGASQCGDMMHDFKMGHIIGASPKYQFIAQGIGILAGIIFCVPIYKLFDSAYEIGGADMPAPAAHAWKAVAEILSKGLEALPLNSQWGILFGAIFGAGNAILNAVIKAKRPQWSPYTISSLAFGIAMLVPAKQSIMMFLGSVFHVIWQRFSPRSSQRLFFSVASGMIAGDGLMAVAVAIIKLAGIKPFFEI